jgi:hypothetical protein
MTTMCDVREMWLEHHRHMWRLFGNKGNDQIPDLSERYIAGPNNQWLTEIEYREMRASSCSP